MAEGTVSPTLSEWLIVILIAVAIVFEAVLHRFEHWMNHKHNHLMSVAKVLYRELMVLGLVSFSFILYQFVNKPDGDTVLSFEFAHVLIFLIALFYTVVVLSTMFISLRLSSRWKQMEQIDLVKYLHLKEEYTRLRMRMHRYRGSLWRVLRWWFPNVFTLFRYRELHEIMTFHDIRFQFIFYRKLPEHFRFSSFLRKIKSRTFIALVESHWTVLSIFLGLLLIDLLRRHLSDTDRVQDVAEAAFIIGSALFLALVVQILAVKIRKVYWELTKHPRVYYEGVEPAAMAEELAAAEDRFEFDRTKARSTRSGTASEDLGTIGDDDETDEGPTRAESELTEPMSHAPLSKSLALAGKPNPEKALPLVPDPAVEFSASDTALSNRRLRSTDRRSEGSSTGEALMTESRRSLDARVSLPENAYMDPSVNHPNGSTYHGRSAEYLRLDRKDALLSAKYGDSRRSRSSIGERPRSRSSIGERPRSKGQSSEPPKAPELHEIAARHSLEVSRSSVTAPDRVLDPNSQSSVALAAVAAARRRSIENQLDRIEMQIERSSVDAGADAEMKSGSNPRMLSLLSSRGVSTDDEGRISGGEYARGSMEGKSKRKGRSIEVAAAMPHDEILARHSQQRYMDADHDLEAGLPAELKSSVEKTEGVRFPFSRNEDKTSDTPAHRMNSFKRHRSLGLLNATIVKNLERQQKAQTMEAAPYPRLVKKLIPRLGRVASPVEKLFWFGSHRFFLWCVEATLYFSTVLTAAATAGLALVVSSKKDKDREITAINIISFVLPPLTLLFVLVRIADIIKKYVFILHNASLVPEAHAIEAIHTVAGKQKPLIPDDLSDLSGSETEREDAETARERRRNLGRFFRSEAESGNIQGIDADASSNPDSQTAAERRTKKRLIALRMRNQRTQAGAQQEANIGVDSGDSLAAA